MRRSGRKRQRPRSLADGADTSPSTSPAPVRGRGGGRVRRTADGAGTSTEEGSSTTPVQDRGRKRGRGRGSGRGNGRGNGRGSGRGSSRGSGRGRGRGEDDGEGSGSARGGRGGRGRLPKPSPPPRPGDQDFIGPLTPTEMRQRFLGSEWRVLDSDSIRFPYSGGLVGPTVPLNNTVTPLDCFSMFFTLEVWELLVTETNRYADKILSQKQFRRRRPWTRVGVNEMKAFYGMLIAMGIVRLPRLEMYWCTTRPLFIPNLNKVMSKTRFEQIYRFLHMSDCSKQVARGQPCYDPLFKVRSLLDIIDPLLLSLYNPHEQLSIDEAMIPFKGRLGMKQYMRDKPTKWGIKVWVLADATNGYVSRLQIYTGRTNSVSAKGLSSRVVLELIRGLEDRHYTLYMDNFYSSPMLFLLLYEMEVNAVGTVRSTRKFFPKSIEKPKSSPSGTMEYRSKGPILAYVWVDNRPVYTLTTDHRVVSGTEIARRRKADGQKEDVPCPPCLPDYQQHMRGVDRADQRIGYYNIGRRGRKWWKRANTYLVEVTLLDAFIIYQHAHAKVNSRDDYLKFRCDLAEQLIGSFSTGGPRPPRSRLDERLNSTLRHLPVASKSKRCIVCADTRNSDGGSRHETNIDCIVCKVPLCCNVRRNCFLKYHTDQIFWC